MTYLKEAFIISITLATAAATPLLCKMQYQDSATPENSTPCIKTSANKASLKSPQPLC